MTCAVCLLYTPKGQEVPPAKVVVAGLSVCVDHITAAVECEGDLTAAVIRLWDGRGLPTPLILPLPLPHDHSG